MKFIEITLPDKKHFLLRVDSIDSVELEEPYPDQKFPTLTICVNSWETPYKYNKEESTSIYEKLKSILITSSPVQN